MFEVRVKNVMERRKLVSAGPVTPVAKAAKLMLARRVGAVLVIDEGMLLGIFTERDALYRVIARGLDPNVTLLANVMTPEPRTVSPLDSFGAALLVMHDNGFRHLPVVEGGKVVGIISARNALDPELEDFTAEAHRREYLRARL
jgi:CBS domain-containing protein